MKTDKDKTTSITLPYDLWERAKIYAIKERIDLKDVVCMALEAHLKGKEGGKGK